MTVGVDDGDAVVGAEAIDVVGGVVTVSEAGPGLLELEWPQAAVPMTTVAPTSAMRTLRVVTGSSNQPRCTVSRDTKK
jgi:hypothetical protein